ncbi:heme o synthase [Rhodobium gokarnense]|uniref:Protoheme IX farnesyltransferase n=1 Tax=Rhodobium gokarnense TaxID=364296 RepID=A0ABT3HCZ5_9HYPH|nr:heme o synthase [Rhodobium gokarnense]MCW2308194.1 protoheme IX farnesyltransferase [Rhodobium gokarnense]
MALTERTELIEEHDWSNELIGEMATVGDYVQLMKLRVMSLVVFTALVGMIIAPVAIHPVLGFIALVCIGVGAGASGALNMWFDADIDAVMSRTAKRPVPSGRVTPDAALAFGMTLALGSVSVLGLVAGWFAAGLLAFTIFFYAVVYTMWLKRWTSQNIVIGGAAGALPPMIGWAVMTGSVSLQSFVLFLIIFLWTPPHFWALSLFKAEEYARAGVPMLPVVAGNPATRRQIFYYVVALALSGFLPVVVGPSGIAYGVAAAVLGGIFVYRAWQLLRTDEENERRNAVRVFTYSILYLFLLFAVLAGEHIVRLMVAS